MIKIRKQIRCISIFSTFSGLFLSGCSGSGSKFPPVTDIEKFKQTQFAPTLETSIERNKNVVYTPAFLYAWDKVRKITDCNRLAGPGNPAAVQLMDQSNSFNDALDSGSYKTLVSVKNAIVSAYASFNKQLPFSTQLEKLDGGIFFDGHKVKAFGMSSLEDKYCSSTEVSYYSDDDHFILTLHPVDSLNEIILVKGLPPIKSLGEAVKKTDVLIKRGNAEDKIRSNLWKYVFGNDSDRYSIPVLNFDISKDYQNIEGQNIGCSLIRYRIDVARQRTSFTLNESGVVIKSVAIDSIEKLADTALPIKSHPKHMDLNKPFYIIIRQKAHKNPYFVMYVANEELMAKL
jgi:hypothetical protein